MSDVGWTALLTDVSTPETRGKIIGSLNFIGSLGRMIGITFAGFLYDNGQGFKQGTIFYIVIAMLLTGTAMMWLMPKTPKAVSSVETKTEKNREEYASQAQNNNIYHWFLTSLIIIVLGVASISQVFLLFLRLPSSSGGLGVSDPEMGFILTAWTVGGMITSLSCGWLADRIGRIKVLVIGLGLAIVTPLSFVLASDAATMALFYGLNGVSFWTLQTAGFAFAGDIIPLNKRARLLGRYNAVIALSWGPAGLLVGGPIADIQIRRGVPANLAYITTFYASSIIVAIGTVLFAVKVAASKRRLPNS
jgi:MFS family permease